MTALLLDLAGRLHHGRKVLPVAPATLVRAGTIGDPSPPAMIVPAGTTLSAEELTSGPTLIRYDGPPPTLLPLGPLADCVWRETTMEAHERQRERDA